MIGGSSPDMPDLDRHLGPLLRRHRGRLRVTRSKISPRDFVARRSPQTASSAEGRVRRVLRVIEEVRMATGE
jgi:hypothetical protein